MDNFLGFKFNVLRVSWYFEYSFHWHREGEERQQVRQAGQGPTSARRCFFALPVALAVALLGVCVGPGEEFPAFI